MRGLCISHFQNPSAVDVVPSRIFTYNNCRDTTKKQKNLVVASYLISSPILSSSLSCSATLSVMAEEEKQTFGVNEAGLLVKNLRQQFKSGKTKSYQWRVSQLKGIVKMVEEKEKEIAEALHADLGKPELEAFVSEISLTKSSCEFILEQLKNWMKPEKAKTSLTTYPSSAEIISEPMGVVLVISAWNYPFLLSLDPVIGAIAAGNAVVLKPSEIAPATSSLLSRLVEEYLDTSSVRVAEGAVPETTALLEQKWDKILYTGSTRVGRIVMTAAAKHLTPVVLELGGKCPAVVDSNVDLKIDALIDGLEECFGKDPLESKDISRIVSLNHYQRLESLLNEDNVSDKIVLGGQRDQNKLRIAPTILLDVPEDSKIMQDEIFGPLLPVITVESINDSFDRINSKPKPLASYLFTNDEKLKKDFVYNVSSGGMVINDAVLHVTVHTLPFGGVGESGMGSYHGKFSFDAFSHKKAVLYRSFNGDASIRYPPYTPTKQKLMKALIKGGIVGLILALLGWSKD